MVFRNDFNKFIRCRIKTTPVHAMAAYGLRRIDENEERHVALTNDKTKDDSYNNDEDDDDDGAKKQRRKIEEKKTCEKKKKHAHTKQKDVYDGFFLSLVFACVCESAWRQCADGTDRKENYAHYII